MSDTARDLLVHGTAAAIARSKEEARFYLEWVLRIDADMEQRAHAYYWLSTISEDPAEKRSCLENVLAIFPGYPEARRDLAIMDGRLKVEEIVDHRTPVQPVTPDATIAPTGVHRYVCPSCGAKTAFDPQRETLRCQFCGYSGSAHTASEAEGQVEEQDWVATIYTPKGHRWELPTERTLTCLGCGATWLLPPTHVSAECPFCAAAHVAHTDEERDLIEPEGVLPFAFKAERARQAIREWLEERRFAPEDLEEAASIAMPSPLYLPFWTFDIGGVLRWTRFVPVREYGQSSLVEEHGSELVAFDDVLVPASRSLPEELLSELDIDTSTIVPYTPDLLADWPAEVYSVSMADASLLAHERAFKEASGRVGRDLRGDSASPTFDRSGVGVISYKLVLLPLWLAHYVYRGATYHVLVNGQTGQVVGSVPRNRLMQFLDDMFGDE